MSLTIKYWDCSEEAIGETGRTDGALQAPVCIEDNESLFKLGEDSAELRGLDDTRLCKIIVKSVINLLINILASSNQFAIQ